jgi:hypothetical protein
MKKNLMLSVLALVCAQVLEMGAQARDQDHVGLTPTPEDAASMSKKTD